MKDQGSRVKGQGLKYLFFLIAILCLVPVFSFAETKEFTLTVTDSEIELNGAKFMVWKYNDMFPGPVLRVKQGDTVKVKLMNKSSAKHGLFFHGQYVNPRVSLQEEKIVVDPGYEYTYGEFVAGPPGTHLYHCRFNMGEHLSRGLYGAFIVEAKPVPAGSKQGDEPKFDKEFIYILSDWNSKAAKGEETHELGHPRTIMDNDITTINDRALNGDNPIVMDVNQGERVRIRLANIGMLLHTLRFPQGFLITHEDGYPISEPKKEESLTIFSGKRYDIVVTADKSGRFLFYHSINMPQGAMKNLMESESKEGSHAKGRQHETHTELGTDLKSVPKKVHASIEAKVDKEIPILALDVKGGGGK